MKLIKDSKTFLEICDKLDDVPDCKLKASTFYTYMIAGIYSEKTLTFVSCDDKGELSGCSVITIDKDITGELILFVVFQWIHPHYKKLWKDYMKFIEGKAEEYKVKKISFVTSRSEDAINRRIGKYGYRKAYNVFEKEIK